MNREDLKVTKKDGYVAPRGTVSPPLHFLRGQNRSVAKSKPENRIIPLHSADRRIVMEPTSGVAEELGQGGLYPDR